MAARLSPTMAIGLSRRQRRASQLIVAVLSVVGLGMHILGRSDVAQLEAIDVVPARTTAFTSIESGGTLAGALAELGFSVREVHTITERLSGVLSPRRVQPGLGATVVRDADRRPLSLQLLPNPDTTVMVLFDSGGEAGAPRIEVTPVVPDTVVLAGTVSHSLYRSLVSSAGEGVMGAREREAVVVELADAIFAWTLDFARDLRPGDSVSVVYVRDRRPDGTARGGRVLAARLTAAGDRHEAYRYRLSDGSTGYFDPDGGSLKRLFLRAPLSFRRISSRFGLRYHPILKEQRSHHGIDYAADAGTPVRAVGDGTVTFASRNGGYGLMVEVRHPRGYITRYGHLRGFARGIRPGTRVSQGQTIGYVGSTGLSTGPHLHYEIRRDGTPVNPGAVRGRTGEPVPAGETERYRRQTAEPRAALDGAFRPR